MQSNIWLVCGICLMASSLCAQEWKSIDLPAKPEMGHGWIAKPADLQPKTIHELRQQRQANAGKGFYVGPPIQSLDLNRTLRWPAGLKLYLSAWSDEEASLAKRLAVLRAFGPTDIAKFECRGEVTAVSAPDIGRMTALVDLTMDADEIWQQEAGAHELATLQELKSLRFEPSTTFPFGSAKLVDALLSLKHLTYLQMPCDGLTEQEVVRLAAHPSLEQLVLCSTQRGFGRDALAAFAGMSRLKELAISCHHRITNDDALLFVRTPKLERVVLCTEAELTCQREFRKRRPDCYLYLRGLDD